MYKELEIEMCGLIDGFRLETFPENVGSRSTDESESSSDSSDSVLDEVSESPSLCSSGSLNDSLPRFLPVRILPLCINSFNFIDTTLPGRPMRPTSRSTTDFVLARFLAFFMRRISLRMLSPMSGLSFFGIVRIFTIEDSLADGWRASFIRALVAAAAITNQ